MLQDPSGQTVCLAWLPQPSLWMGVAARLRQLAEAASRSRIPVQVVAAVGEPVDLGQRVRIVRCDQIAGDGWPVMSRFARYRLLAAALPADCARIVLRMPGAADPSLPAFLQRWGQRTITEHHGDEIAERLRQFRGPLDQLRTGAEAIGMRVLLRGVAGAVGVTPEIAGILSQRGPAGLYTGWTGNGIDVPSVPMTGHRRYTGGRLELAAVLGNAAPWHGIDRLIRGMAEHRGVPVRLHLIGDIHDIGQLPAVACAEMVRHGRLSGPALDQILASVHLGVASLAMHRAGLTQACPLKSREYAARGLPFVYAYDDPDLPADLSWCLRLPAGEDPLPMDGLLSFAANLPDDAAARMRAFASERLDWSVALTRMHALAVEACS